LITVRQQLESYQSCINHLESLLLRTTSSDTHTLARHVLDKSSIFDNVTEKVHVQSSRISLINDDEISKDDEID
ncbi:unnamed protein product, partial [Rotaria sordida]